MISENQIFDRFLRFCYSELQMIKSSFVFIFSILFFLSFMANNAYGAGSPGSCNQSSQYGCTSGLTNYGGVCRNPSCLTQPSCLCTCNNSCVYGCDVGLVCNGSVCRNPSCINNTTCDCPTSSIPNCYNLSGPSSIILGDSGTYSANFTSAQGNLSGQIFYDNYQSIKQQACAGTSCSLSGSWTPAAAGTYTVYCRAWNDGIAECRPPSLVDGPPRYPCDGPTYQMSVNVTASYWIKLNNLSFFT